MPSRWVILAWANFALAVAAVLKFIPILVSLRHGLVLSPEQIAAGLGDERLWSLDLISDTPYLCVCVGWSLCGCADRPEASGCCHGVTRNRC